MIKLNQNKAVAEEYRERILTPTGKNISLRERIDQWVQNNPNALLEKEIMTFLKKNLADIITFSPDELQRIVSDFKVLGWAPVIYDEERSKPTEFGKQIAEYFGYDRFRKSAKAVWLSKNLSIKSCVYCNTQYGLTIKHNGKHKLLFHFDHYFPKSKYPFLSLSFYNLIPCCASCNMTKSNREYSLDQHFHPYEESIHEYAKYGVEEGDLTRYILSLDEEEFNIRFDLREGYQYNTSLKRKLKNYHDEFKIEAQYSQFKDVAGETLLRRLYYNSSRKRELADLFENEFKIKLDRKMIDRFVLGAYTADKDLLKRPLSKFIKDIGEVVDEQ